MLRAAFISSVALLSCGAGEFAFADNLRGEAVVLRALDKVTASTQDFTVAVGDKLSYGSLTVEVKHCEKRPPEDIPETYAFLQIFDAPPTIKGKNAKRPQDPQENIKVFSGWMLSSNPAAAALDHRVYDIWVLDCKVPPSLMDLRPAGQ